MEPMTWDDVLDPPIVTCILCDDELREGDQDLCRRCVVSLAADVADDE
jgi:hypothetical protein